MLEDHDQMIITSCRRTCSSDSRPARCARAAEAARRDELRLEDEHMWLLDPENQRLAVWEKAFVAYFTAVRIHVVDKLLKPSEVERLTAATARQTFEKLETICHELAPVVANRGAVWHVGDNRRVYAGGCAVGASSADAIVVGAKSERLWTVAFNMKNPLLFHDDLPWHVRDVRYRRPGSSETAIRSYTYVEDGSLRTGLAHHDSVLVDSSASDCAVLGGPNGREYVVVASGPELRVREWDESLPGDTKWVGTAVDTIALEDHTIYRVCAVSLPATDRFYVLAKQGPEWTIKYTNYTPADTSANAEWLEVGHADDVVGITADETYLVAFGPTTIRRIRHADVAGGSAEWETIDNPDSTFEETGDDRDWAFRDVHASADGALLAVIDRKPYVWCALTKTWTRSQCANVKKAFRLPMKGAAVFQSVRATVEERLSLFEMSEDLDETQDTLEAVTGLRPAWLTAPA